jgi:hypothetical protein
MFNGKIELTKSDSLSDVLTDQNFRYLRDLTVEDNGKYLWLPTEQLIALPHIKFVEDKDGRTFVQNETILISIHDYIELTNPNKTLQPYFSLEQKEIGGT